jgi:hypothetical protein
MAEERENVNSLVRRPSVAVRGQHRQSLPSGAPIRAAEWFSASFGNDVCAHLTIQIGTTSARLSRRKAPVEYALCGSSLSDRGGLPQRGGRSVGPAPPGRRRRARPNEPRRCDS